MHTSRTVGRRAYEHVYLCIYANIFCIENVMRNTLAVDSFYFYYYLFLRGGQVS